MADQQQKVKGVVDIVFLLDVTGSMQSCIDALKDNIKMFVDVLTTKDANNACPVKDWRAKAVGYRDFEADAEPFVDNQFVRTADDLKSQLDRLRADGGGDEPESLLDAVYKIANMGQIDKGLTTEDPSKWRYRSDAARVVVVFTDAPFKETMAIPEAKGGKLFNDVQNAVYANRIILNVFAPDMPCYNDLAALDKSVYEAIPIAAGQTPQQALKDFTTKKENFRNTMMALAKSVSKSEPTPEAG